MNVKSADIKRITDNNKAVIGMLKTFLPHGLPPKEYDIRDNKYVKMIKKLEESDNVLLYGLDRLEEINLKDSMFVNQKDYDDFNEHIRKSRLIDI